MVCRAAYQGGGTCAERRSRICRSSLLIFGWGRAAHVCAQSVTLGGRTEQLLVSTGSPKPSRCRRMLGFQPAQGENSISLEHSLRHQKSGLFSHVISRLEFLSIPHCSQEKGLIFSCRPLARARHCCRSSPLFSLL